MSNEIAIETVVGADHYRPMNGRLYTLDAMRGVAAIAVVLFHIGLITRQHVPGGYLAVDFFFALSGFIIARTYGPALAAGSGIAAFAQARLVRLYPLFLLGLILGVIRMAGAVSAGREAWPGLPTLVLNLVMLPSTPSNMLLFPFNNPSWSLFFEIVANVIFAMGLWRASTGARVVLMIVAAAFLVAITDPARSLDIGFGWHGAIGGFARVAFSFMAGMVVEAVASLRPRPPSLWAILPIGVLATVLLWPLAPGDAGRMFFDLAAVLVIFPLIVIAGLNWALPARLTPAARFFGNLSYPLYAVHQPLLLGMRHWTKRLPGHPALGAAVEVALLIAAAWLASVIWDRPLHRAFMASMAKQPSRDPAPAR